MKRTLIKGFISLLILPTFALFPPYSTLATQPRIIQIGKLFSESQVVWEFEKTQRIFSLVISGSLELYEDNSLLRVILVRDDLHEYLVYEAYPLIVNSNTLKITDVCEETCVLEGIAPRSLKIELVNASLQINEISVTEYPPTLGMEAAHLREQIKADQDAAKIKKLNENIEKKGLKWIAAETFVSKLSYEEKKKLFGGKVPNLQGAEYYKGGIFEIKSPDSSEFSFTGSESSLEVRVSASSDDAEETVATGSVLLDSNYLDLIHDSGPGRGDQLVGIRFNGVNIPPGAKILNSYIQFTQIGAESGTALLSIEGEAADDVPTFESSSFNISSRDRTAIAVPWSPPPWTTPEEAGPDQRTPDISLVVQEIVDRPDWSSGNSLAFIITGTGRRVAVPYNRDPEGAPLLHVEYEISELIENFDWRSRHGANNPDSPYYDGDPMGSGWITSITRQGCSDCWAHSAVGATEALANLYFNQHLDVDFGLDLSLQDILSCSGAGSCSGGSAGGALSYIANTGVVDEGCFPYAGSDEPCDDKCPDPYEIIRINSRVRINPSDGEENIKRNLIDHGPLNFGIDSWWHSMVLVGYDRDYEDGKPVWILKNSWGSSWGEDGYGKIKVDLSDMYMIYVLQPPVKSIFTPFEIACHDMDGDGLYNWGLSENKPASCPEDAFAVPDCDDSNPDLGPFDVNGSCIELPMADFTANPITGPVPLTVQFTDQSMGVIEVWDWGFGDGETISEQNPSHTYNEPGNYSVVLTVTGAAGTHTESKSDYITVCVPNTYYKDADKDGYGDPNDSTQACSLPPGYVTDNTDCNDSNSAVHPDATEVCNHEDDNCNDEIDEGVKNTYYRDSDGDGYGDSNKSREACLSPSGYVEDHTDCNDSDSTIYPGAAEVCNGIDDDCDGSIDEGVTNTYHRDADGDTYGNPNNPKQACSQPSGCVMNNLDCDDSDANEHPNQRWYKDLDSDGYSDGSTNTVSCTRPVGFKVESELTATSGDCDDSDQNRYPGAPEACNGKDDDCDGQTDEGCVVNNPPEANAGTDRTIVEGYTVILDGSGSSDPDPEDSIASYQWTQLGGIPVTLSDPTSPRPTFLTPIVSPAGMILTFNLIVKDKGDLQDNDQVTITVNDNGISGFPDDVLTMICSTGKAIGIKVESGGDCTSIAAVDPDTIPDSSDKPNDLPYGLFDLQIKTANPGDTVKATFYLEDPAGSNYTWFKYKDSTGKWEDYSANTSFNAARDQVTLTLVDGGDGDDGPADGWIVDPSGLSGTASTSTSSGGGGGGGGGCFIATATDG